jgi:hypothetical protein
MDMLNQLQVRTDLPADILALPAQRLYEALSGPTLVHLDGRRKPPLFLSVLQHGNEDTGWRVVQQVLRERGANLPRSLSILIGNVRAARYRKRRLNNQADYNRSWDAGDTTEHAIMHEVVRIMRQRGVFASVDIHNNSGINPHYACINRLLPQYLHLARMFSRMVIYFTSPSGVQSLAFGRFCPAVTLECGQPGDEFGIQLACRYVNELLDMEQLPSHPVPEDEFDLFHTVAVVKVPETASMSFAGEPADIEFIQGIERLNFEEIPSGTILARVNDDQLPLQVMDDAGMAAGEQFFEIVAGELRTRTTVMPSMLTTDERIIRQDCLCYLMERYELKQGEKPLPRTHIWN